jgi:hypothetical protein
MTEGFLERLIQEHGEHSSRTEKLSAFIGSEAFAALPQIERDDLIEQLGHMRKYGAVLLRRASRLCTNA